MGNNIYSIYYQTANNSPIEMGILMYMHVHVINKLPIATAVIYQAVDGSPIYRSVDCHVVTF